MNQPKAILIPVSSQYGMVRDIGFELDGIEVDRDEVLDVGFVVRPRDTAAILRILDLNADAMAKAEKLGNAPRG